MPETIEWPMHGGTSSPRRRGIVLLLVLIFVILLGSRSAISYWVDLLWFRSLGYGEVFWKARSLQWTVFGGFAAATFIALFGAFSLLKRSHRDDLPSTHTVLFGGQQVHLPI